MKKTEDLLRKAPLRTPSESMDRNMDALFREARQSAGSGWLTAGVPAWTAALACLLCLVAGMQIAPQHAEDSVRVETPDKQPDVLVQVARSNSSASPSPFIRNQARRENRFSSEWTISN